MKIFETYIKDITAEYGTRMSPKYYNTIQTFSNVDCYIKLSDKNTFIIESGSYIKEYISSEDGIPYLRVSNEKNYIIDESSMVYIKKNVADKIKVIEKDIIFGRTQANLDKLGVFSMIDEKLSGSAISQHVTKIRIKTEKFHHITF